MLKWVTIGTIAFCFHISGCQSTANYNAQAQTNNETLFHDKAFPRFNDTVVESPEEIFELNDEIRDQVRRKVMSEPDFHRRSVKLIEFIFGTDYQSLAYQSSATMTAQQAFNAKTANCISLTILAYSLAEMAGLDASFQDVKVPEYWVRSGDYNMLSGHVNLRIKRRHLPNNNSLFLGVNGGEIDFDPFIQKQNFPKKIVSKNVVSAMFYNNKAAMALVERDYDRAYSYLKAAIEIAPEYAPAWSNLGILYRFNDYNDLAEKSYRHSISIEESSLNTLNNLSILLEMNGDFEESKKIDSAIIKQRIKNPYYHALLADEAMYDGLPDKAIMHYKRAIKLDSRIHELHFGIAKAYNAKGDIVKARNALRKAIKENRTPQIESRYIAKLNLLKQRG